MSLLIIITSINVWIQKVRALAKSTRPKSFLDTTCKSISVRQKLNTAPDILSRFSQRSQIKEKTLRNKNFQILHHLQTSLIRTNILTFSFSSFILAANLSLLRQVLICRTYIKSQLYPFRSSFEPD